MTSVTAWPPETAADSPFTSYSFPPLSSVAEPYENDRPVLVEPAAGTVAFHQASARLRHLHTAGRVRTAVHAPLHAHALLRGRGTVPDRRGFQGLADGPERPLLGTVPVGGVDLHVRTVRALPSFTSNAMDGESADTSLYTDPLLTATHFCER
mgnify:CR=1 FL=1